MRTAREILCGFLRTCEKITKCRVAAGFLAWPRREGGGYTRSGVADALHRPAGCLRQAVSLRSAVPPEQRRPSLKDTQPYGREQERPSGRVARSVTARCGDAPWRAPCHTAFLALVRRFLIFSQVLRGSIKTGAASDERIAVGTNPCAPGSLTKSSIEEVGVEPSACFAENGRNRGTSNAACIGTSHKVEVGGGFPGAKRESSCFARGSDRGSIVSGLKSSSGGGIVRKTRPAVAFGMKGAKNEPTLSLSKRKLATKAKIAPPKATYASPRAVTISAVAVCRPA